MPLPVNTERTEMRGLLQRLTRALFQRLFRVADISPVPMNRIVPFMKL